MKSGWLDHSVRLFEIIVNDRAAQACSGKRRCRLYGKKNPVLSELEALDADSLSPLEALNKLFEWKKKFKG